MDAVARGVRAALSEIRDGRSARAALIPVNDWVWDGADLAWRSQGDAQFNIGVRYVDDLGQAFAEIVRSQDLGKLAFWREMQMLPKAVDEALLPAQAGGRNEMVFHYEVFSPSTTGENPNGSTRVRRLSEIPDDATCVYVVDASGRRPGRIAQINREGRIVDRMFGDFPEIDEIVPALGRSVETIQELAEVL